MDSFSNGTNRNGHAEPHRNGHAEPRRKIASARAPLAIVGMGCRFPGGSNGPEAFWRMLRDGVDAITDIPADRWNIESFFDPEPNQPGKTNTRWGGFIEGIDQFDAHFFGISPREAERMDPQQRLLLEVAFEALEDGGQPLERWAGQDVAVWMGMSSWDYNTIQSDFRDRSFIDVHSNTGSTLSIAANRISYCFNFKGTSAVVDTACSSALLAVHLACQSLWNEECHLALAGGVNVLLDPNGYIGFTKLSMMSPDGRCKAFDARANGFVRSEGAGVVVLKPLAHALADRDRIYALIRATATNQDGRTRSMTVPSQEAQERLLREACRDAGIDPTKIQYVEAHGTGTPVGDPIEARALGSALGVGRPAGSPLLIGSVKTNIGHLESASGIAGLIKAASSVFHRQIPANLHFQTPNPDIPFESLGLRVPARLEPWPESSEPAMAGINSFGFGGLNALVILQEAPRATDPREAAPDAGACLLPLSARSPEALMSLAVSYKDYLNQETGSLRDLVYTTSLRRSHHDHRLAVVAHSVTEVLEQLSLYTTGEPTKRIVTGRVLSDHAPAVSFVFSGQGPQWWAMGRQLLSQEPVFAAMMGRCDEILQRELGWSLLRELTAEESLSRMEETAIAQPAIFAVQVSLAEVWRSWGVRPSSVVGHSVGEVAAAYTAGALSLEDAVRVIGHRGRCMELAPAKGGMLAVGMSLEQAHQVLAPYEEVVSLAAVNSPSSLTLSGPTDILKTIAMDLERRGIFGRMLRVNYAFHSPGLEPVRNELLEALADVKPRATSLPLYSTVTGRLIAGTELDAEYWWRNLRQPVLFADAIKTLVDEQRPRVFLEVGPHPVLAGPMSECFAAQGFSATIVPSLRRGEEERPTMLRGLGELYTLGYPVSWKNLAGEGRLVSLPNYPWQHQRYWHEPEEMRQMRVGLLDHPLLGHRLKSPHPTWEAKLERRRLPWLEDHKVEGQVVVAGMAYVEMAIAAARKVQPAEVLALSDVKFVKACLVSDGQAPTVRTILEPENSTFQIHGRNPGADSGWAMLARGTIRPRSEKRPVMSETLDEIRRRCPIEVAQDECYRQIREAGLDFGPAFRGVSRLWRGEGECLARIDIPAAIVGDKMAGPLHPATMDACFHFLGTMGLQQATSASNGSPGAQGAFLFVEIGELQIYAWTGQPLWSRVWLTERGRDQIVVNCQVFEETGAIVWEARGLRCQAIGFGNRDAEKAHDDLVYQSRWLVQPLPHRRSERRDSADLPGVELLGRHVQGTAGEVQAAGNIEARHTAFHTDVDQLCLQYAIAALAQLGCDWPIGRQFSLEALADELHVVPQHQRILKRCLGWLVEEQILACSDEGWRVARPLPAVDPQETWRTLLFRHPAFYADLTLLRKCGQSLAQVLRGDVDPLQLIFPGGSLSDAEQLYQHGVVWRFHNLVVQDALSVMVEQLPKGRRLRVLEIGGGTGGMTSYLAPCLPADRVEYVFTDLSAHFLGHVQQKLRDYPFLRYERLDIEQDPLNQGFESQEFDVIVASQVLHATADLRQTLNHIGQLLAPSGWVMIAEFVRPQRLADSVFGLLEGWWRFRDAPLRTEHPFLDLTQWQSVLAESGFENALDLSGSAAVLGNAVIGARRSAAVATEAVEEPPVPRTEHPGFWLLLADHGGFGQRLSELLEARGDRCILVRTGEHLRQLSADHFELAPANPDELPLLLKQLDLDWTTCRSIVHLWSLDAPAGESLTPEIVTELQSSIGLSAMHLVQLLSDQGVSSPRLVLVTRQAQAIDSLEKSVSPLPATLWGLGRVINNEAPHFRCRMIDLGDDDQETYARSLVEELWEETQEDEVAFRGQARLVHRFVRGGLDLAAKGPGDAGSTARPQTFRLEASASGTLEALKLRALARRPPAAGEVEIEVRAAGLNFSDVMKALGLYPGLPEGPVPLGLECGGIVTAVGAGVQEFRPGDRVLGFANFSFSKHLCVAADSVFPIPDELCFEEAATMPVAFLTAAYALHHLGRMQPGERVLIHSATGGVGLAAIQLAKLAGAEIFATAGSPEKRDLLHALGVEHVMDSRSLAFAEEVMKRTGGQGVDLVLNSLSGEAIPKGLSVLAEHGRFIEIGKRDIYQNRNLGMAVFRKNVSLLVLDAMRLTAPQVAVQIRSMLDLLRQGKIAPLPHRVFPLTDIRGAFQCMAHAKHIGKVVVSLDGVAGHVAPASEQPPVARADGSYLITGGLGGFGLATARWLVDQGARHLALIGRHGAASLEAQQGVRELEEAGARVNVICGDVSQPEDVVRALQQIERTMPPLRGVIHGAMVLDDGMILNLTPERWQRVMAPKAVGAWNLHDLTRHLPLDFFVCYSSMSSVFGVAGQANYSAANSFLDSLAHHRRTLGLPGLSINWGYVGEVGYVAKNEKVSERFATWGLRGVGPRQGLALLARLIHDNAGQAAILNVDWEKWRPPGDTSVVPPRFQDLYVAARDRPDQGQTDGTPLRGRLLAVDESARKELLQGVVGDKVAKILGTTTAKLDVNTSLTEMGLDSLVGMELRNWIESELQVSISIVGLTQGLSVVQLTELLLEKLSPEAAAETPPASGAPNRPDLAPTDTHTAMFQSHEVLAEHLGRLPENEVDSLLAKMLTE